MAPKKVAATWQWENDSASYTDFDAAANKILEELFVRAGGTGTARCKMPSGWDYEFDFVTLTQTNLETKKTRTIRRLGPALPAAAAAPAAVAAAEPPATYQWQWKDDKNVWQNYDAAGSDKLEAEYKAAAAADSSFSAAFKLGQWNYVFDFFKMQQINSSTKKAREIQRVVTSGTGTDLSAKIAANHAKATGGGAAAAADEDEDDDDDGPPTKKARVGDAGRSVPTASAGGGGSNSNNNAGASKPGQVDPHCGLAGTAHVYRGGSTLWQCTLNQTNLGTNNNKFYIIQLLESDAGAKYWVFTRWGRVGAIGQSALDPFGSLPAAESFFNSKFRDKTKNDWPTVASAPAGFVKHAGKYQLMDMVVAGSAAAAAAVDDEMATLDSIAPSSLPGPVQGLIKMIANKADWERTLKDLEIDTKKMPLGQVSKRQIKDAFGYLKQIETELAKPRPNNNTILEASSMFYTLIPHDFGMMVPPAIRDEDHLKRKMDMLETLSDIEVASGLLKEVKRTGRHPLDSTYAQLKCKIEPLPAVSDEYTRIVEYVRNTHGKTHTAYKIQVDNVFTLEREGERARYEHSFGALHNKMLLWHGSRTSNFMGILSQGLRIAPPEAPVTGYMYGKGVYFADVATKSGNYCHTTSANNRGLLILCEVALGDIAKFKEAKYMDRPQAGTHSTMGVGKMEPNPAEQEVVDGVIYPKGRMHDTPGVGASALLYHEYIVYDTSQLRMRYIVECTFRYGAR